MQKTPEDCPVSQNVEITYWLKKTTIDFSYMKYTTYRLDSLDSYLCVKFVKDAIRKAPKWIKLTLSPFKRRGYTKVVITPFSNARIGSSEYVMFHSLEIDIVRFMPNTFWFKLEEWK